MPAGTGALAMSAEPFETAATMPAAASRISGVAIWNSASTAAGICSTANGAGGVGSLAQPGDSKAAMNSRRKN